MANVIDGVRLFRRERRMLFTPGIIETGAFLRIVTPSKPSGFVGGSGPLVTSASCNEKNAFEFII